MHEMLILWSDLDVLHRHLDWDGSKMNAELRFNSLQDFEPDNVVQQVEPLRKLVDARQKLKDLLSKTDGNDKLEQMLQNVMQNANAQKQLANSLGLSEEPEKKGDGSNE